MLLYIHHGYVKGSSNPIVNIKCGLVVSTAHSWLAATPNGWVSDSAASPSQGIVEFKNPYSYGDLAVSDAITARNVTVSRSIMATLH